MKYWVVPCLDTDALSQELLTALFNNSFQDIENLSVNNLDKLNDISCYELYHFLAVDQSIKYSYYIYYEYNGDNNYKYFIWEDQHIQTDDSYSYFLFKLDNKIFIMDSNLEFIICDNLNFSDENMIKINQVTDIINSYLCLQQLK